MSDGIPNYLPGMEPDNIQKLLNSFFGEIDAQFPDKTIVWSEWNHDRWDKAAGYLCKSLGYTRGKDFLEAYGYSLVQERSEIINLTKETPYEQRTEKTDISNSQSVAPSTGKKRKPKTIECPICERPFNRSVYISCPYCGTDPSTGLPQKSSTQENGLAFLFLVVGIFFILVPVYFVMTNVVLPLNRIGGKYYSQLILDELKGTWLLLLIGIFLLYISLASIIGKAKLNRIAKSNQKEYKKICIQRAKDIEKKNKEKEETRTKQLAHTPVCPICGSKEHVIRITTFNRSMSVYLFGIASKSLGKQFRCTDCDYDF